MEMTSSILFLGSFVPALMICYFVYELDDHKEPLKYVIAAFLIGVLSPLITLQLTFALDGYENLAENPIYKAFFLAAIPEEVGRFLLLGLICHTWKVVNEPFDCVVYAAAIWSGFSAIETSLYAINEVMQGSQPAFLLAARASLCTLGHVSYGVIVGAYLGIAMYANQGFWKWVLRGLMIAIMLHAIYDGILFSAAMTDAGVMYTLIAVAADALTILLALFFMIRMDRIQKLSSYEGEHAEEEARLLMRHRPDETLGLFGLISGFGLGGFILVMISMFLTSLSTLLMLHLANFNVVSFAFFSLSALGAWATWKKIVARVKVFNDQSGLKMNQEIQRLKEQSDEII